MAFTISILLLTPARLAQLTTALASPDNYDPLSTILAEAEASVALRGGGREFSDAERGPMVRAIALHNAYIAAGLAVPKDIADLYRLRTQMADALNNLDNEALGGEPLTFGLNLKDFNLTN